MRLREIRTMAKDMGIGMHRMKKAEITPAIQREQKNIECYCLPGVDICQEEACVCGKTIAQPSKMNR